MFRISRFEFRVCPLRGQTTKRILILGASTRAAAMSALRAGYHPVCADLFADEDLRAIADVLPVENYPRGLVESARRAPPCPWMYTGALENHPSLIEAISAERFLYGCAAAAVRSVRDPVRLCELLITAGLPALQVRTSDSPPPPDGTWMLKPLRSAAGRGIRVWNETAVGELAARVSEPHYFQQRSPGLPHSALYLADAHGTHRIGFTRQLIGEPALHAAGCKYCGSLGPLELPAATARTLDRMATLIAARCRLRGLIGVDFLLEGTTPFLTEVNPRYTASVEVYEAAFDLPLLRHHIAAFDPSPALPTLDIPPAPPRIAAKAILFAAEDITAPALSNLALPAPPPPATLHLADIPTPGSHIPQDHPICTLLTQAPTPETCLQTLNTTLPALTTHLCSRPSTTSLTISLLNPST